MIRFDNDYTRGVHPEILARLVETNLEQTPGYGDDIYCQRAAAHIKKACKNENIDVHFMVGGTIANLTVISASLRPHEAVVAANTGHVFTSETGAIEATGHKVLTITTDDGKLNSQDVRDLFLNARPVHAPKPGMIYISQSTECGTVYTKSELTALKAVADEFGVPFFIDGARLGYAMASSACDVTLNDLVNLSDVFYIGGTKVGALFGEAIVIVNDRLKRDFRYLMKQRGGLLAKGRLLGLQFDVLFEQDLYSRISIHAVNMASLITEAVREAGLDLRYPALSNQVFVKMSPHIFEKLSQKFAFIPWEKTSDYIVGRFCTDWSTTIEDVKALIDEIKRVND